MLNLNSSDSYERFILHLEKEEWNEILDFEDISEAKNQVFTHAFILYLGTKGGD